ncbi:MAG: HD domain-containing protein [Ignavibacteriae bacterium]|nr:HD domain-containing protein [Ignavibacteriota bacterium]
MESEILEKVEEYVSNLFNEKSPAENVYHNLTHTKLVVKTVKVISDSENLTDNDKEIVAIAGWFHDVGYTETCAGHEEISFKYATEFLKKQNYSNENIDKIAQCIKATKIPHEPNNILDEILCDADIHHLGKKKFFEKSDLLRLEIENRANKKLSDLVWISKNIKFLSNHVFFTSYAKLNYNERKNKNLIILKKEYKKEIEKLSQGKQKSEKFAFEKEKYKSKKENEKKADRGIETMFRNVMRTHISFSSMADSKANIMISVNTLLLGAIATILARKLDTNPYLIIPTLTLTIVSLTTLIFAILVTRPSVTSGKFTKDDIEKKKANLLFFGNFFNMNIKDFTWGMQEMMNDKDYLYGSMIKDFYFLGQVLGRKYKYLRICYSIFMYGFIISIILFAVFIYLNPETSHVNSLIE